MTLAEKLASIKVLYRAPDTLTLYGIPYDMRPGQQPGDLWRAHRDYVEPKPGHYGSKRIDISDWVYLGEPGWYSSSTAEEIAHIAAFLEAHNDNIPGNPHEWTKL